MSDNDELDRVLIAARRGFEPHFEDKLRLRRALAQKLAAGGWVMSLSSGVWGALSSKLLWGAVTLGAAGFLAFAAGEARDTSSAPTLAARPAPAPVPAPIARTSAPVAERPGVVEPVSRPSTAKPVQATAPLPSSAEPKNGALAQETALLLEARSALRRREPQRAIALLGTYESRFQGGLLRPEVHGTRILALCDLGRETEARRAATVFNKRWPSSPMAARLLTSCVGETLAPPTAP